MKNLYLLLVFMSFECFSQVEKHFVIKTNSLNYLVKSGFNISTEFETKNAHSLNFTFEIGDNKYSYETDNKKKFIVAVIERRKYYYTSNKAINPTGIFVSPYLKYRYKDKNIIGSVGFFANDGVYKAHSLGVGMAVGYQNIIFKRIAIEGKIGLGFIAKVSSKGITQPPPITPDGLIGLSFGFRI